MGLVLDLIIKKIDVFGMKYFSQIFIATFMLYACVLGSIVVSIPACHAGDRGSIPRRGGYFSMEFAFHID